METDPETQRFLSELFGDDSGDGADANTVSTSGPTDPDVRPIEDYTDDELDEQRSALADEQARREAQEETDVFLEALFRPKRGHVESIQGDPRHRCGGHLVSWQARWRRTRLRLLWRIGPDSRMARSFQQQVPITVPGRESTRGPSDTDGNGGPPQMSAVLRACAVCAKPSPKPYCQEHQRDRWAQSKRQSRMGIGGGTWEALRHKVITRDLRCCYLCDQVISEGDQIEVDHLVEVADGGTNDLSNLATAHVACHRRRHREPDWAAERIEKALKGLGGGGGHPDIGTYVGSRGRAGRAPADSSRGDL